MNRASCRVAVLIGLGVIIARPMVGQVIGRITDATTKEPLAYAVLQIRAMQEDSVMSFGYSDIDGLFSLDISPLDSFDLEVRLLGYVPHISSHPPTENDLIVEMHSASAELENIIIKERAPPMAQSGDTTVYQTRDFTDSTETVLEDMLKKLPGFYIEDNGKIKVYGRDLDVLLIEGSDMFGQDYTVATKNIRSHVIKSVEVIEGFSDDPVLQPIYEEDQLAINLKLYDEHKGQINGTVFGGVGYGEEVKYESLGNIFYFDTKAKGILLSSNHNIGAAHGASLDMDPAIRGWINKLSSDYPQIPPAGISTAGLDPIVVNNAHQLHQDLRTDFTIGSQRIKVGVKYGVEDDDQARSSNEEIDGQQVYDAMEDQGIQSKGTGLKAEHVYLSRRGAFSVKTVAGLHHRHQDSDFRALYRSLEIMDTERLHVDRQNDQLGWGMSSNVSKRFGLHTAGVIKLYCFDGQWDDKEVYEDDGRLDTLIDYQTSFLQSVTRSTRQLGGDMNMYWRWRDWVIRTGVHFKSLDEKNVRSWLGDQNDQSALEESAIDREDLTLDVSLINDARSGTRLNATAQWDRSTLSLEDDQSDVQGLYRYSAGMTRELGKSSTIRLSAFSYLRRPDILNLLELTYLQGAFHLASTGGIEQLEKASGIHANYSYRQPVKQFAFSQNVRYTFDQDQWTSRVVLFDQQLTRSTPFYAQNGRALSTFTNLSKFISPLRINAQLTLRYRLNYADVFIGDVQTRQESAQYAVRAKFAKSILGLVSIQNETAYRRDEFANRRGGAFVPSFTLGQVHNIFSLTVFPKNWKLSTSWHHLQFVNQGRRALNRMSFTCRYDFADSKFIDGFRLQIQNIGLSDNWTDQNSDGLTTSISRIETVSPFVLLTMDVGI